MAYNSWGIAGQPIGGQIQRSRYAPDIQETLARQMLAEGTSTAPVQHWTQGLARLLQGYMGGQIANRAAQEREQRQQGQQQTLAQALAAMQGRPGGIETTPGGTSIDWQAQPGSAKNAAAILAQNPDLAGMGFQLQMSEAEREQARQQRMADIADERAYKKGETADERAWRESQQEKMFQQQRALEGMRQARASAASKPPSGYMWNPEGTGLLPIPGSKADIAQQQTDRQQEGLAATMAHTIRSGRELENEPGRAAATGMSHYMSLIPGTDAKTFQAKLDTFKAQNFIPQVQQLKGMGALSDAEGKKLMDAIGALDPSMGEEAFLKSLQTINYDLEGAYGRLYGNKYPLQRFIGQQSGNGVSPPAGSGWAIQKVQ